MENADKIIESTYFDREFVAYSFEVINQILEKDVFTDKQILDGNRIVLAESAVKQLIHFDISTPYAFRLKSKVGIEMYASIHNFEGEDRSVYLPRWMMETLHIDDGDCIIVQSVRLPNVKKVILRVTDDFLKTFDPRCVVEIKLRGMQVICVGQKIKFTHAKREYKLVVEKLEPENAGSIVDADLTLEFISV